MNKMIDSLFNICYLEELARRDRWINKLHPLVKFIVTLLYIFSVAGLSKYDLQGLILYATYPVLIIVLGDIPFSTIGKKMIVPMLLGASLGILNPLLDQQMIRIGSLVFSAGYLSLMTLMIKSVLMITASLLLITTTSVEDLAYALRQLKLPKIMVIQFLLTYRYINLLVNEVNRTVTAYSLRSGGSRKIGFSAWGSLVGQLFMRVSKRSVTLYEAMALRGFEGDFKTSGRRLRFIDGAYLSFWVSVFGILIGMRTI